MQVEQQNYTIGRSAVERISRGKEESECDRITKDSFLTFVNLGGTCDLPKPTHIPTRGTLPSSEQMELPCYVKKSVAITALFCFG